VARHRLRHVRQRERAATVSDDRTTAEKGYGWAHQQERERWAPKVKTGRVRCSRCTEPIGPREPWDLDHTDDRKGYLGPAHRRCNRGGWRPPKSNPDPTPRTEW